ncbi:MAG: hypothetical protein V3R84_04775, partial [Acidimicrobiia bacterium]
EVPSTTTAPTPTRTEAGDAAGSSLYPYNQPDAVPLPAMGIATADFGWQVTEMLEATGGEVWLNQLFQFDGTLWAVGGGYDQAADRELSFVESSSDGVTWTPVELPGGMTSGNSNISFSATDDVLVATVNSWEEETGRSSLKVFVSADGVTWAQSDLSSSIGANESWWVSQVGGGDGVLLLAATKENMQPRVDWEPPTITFEKNGYLIALEEGDWTYSITDAATGEVIHQGSQERLWNRGEDEFGIYDPVAGEVVFPMDWDSLRQAASAAYAEAQWGEPLVVTLTAGDRTLALDEYSGVVTVTDASGAVLFSGIEEEIWQGPPPTFTNPSTGEVLAVIPWDEWNAAHEGAYPILPQEEGGYYATTELLRSADQGATWTTVNIDGIIGPGFYFQSLVHGPNGFLAVGNQEQVFEEHEVGLTRAVPQRPIVLASADGAAWSEVSTNLAAGAWVSNITTNADGYLAVVGDEGGSRVIGSADGRTWQPVLSEDDLDLPLGNVWFDRIVSGGLGTFATGTYDGWEEPEQELRVAAISRDGRTLTIGMPMYTVTDDATGSVLATFDESDYYAEEEVGSATERGFKWGQGGIVMFNDDGTVVFAASNEEFERAMESVWAEPEIYYQSEQVLLYNNGGEWARVPLPDDLGPNTWIGGIVVTDTSVVLTATGETSSATLPSIPASPSGLPSEFSTRSLSLVGVPG